MKKKKIILIGAAVAAVVVIGIGVWTLFGRKSSDGSTENVVYVNSVDNLYKEKSLKNKIETRAVNSSMMYGMRGQIDILEKQIDQLQKRSITEELGGEK